MTVFYDQPLAYFVHLEGTDQIAHVLASAWHEDDHAVCFEIALRMESEERRELGIHVPAHGTPQDRVVVEVARFPKALVRKVVLAMAGE